MDEKNYWCPFKNEKCNATCVLFNTSLKKCEIKGMALNIYNIRQDLKKFIEQTDRASNMVGGLMKAFVPPVSEDNNET